MSRRDQIRMSHEEQVAFIAGHRTVTCATTGPTGRPHLMPLWFLSDGLQISAWTYGTSQKVRNLERDPRATLQLEAGTTYEELRGVMLECDAELVRDLDAATTFGLSVAARYAPEGVDLTAPEAAGPLRDMVAAQAAKRVVLRFTPTRVVSWDHRKLGGVY